MSKMNFEMWMKQVDLHLLKLCGMISLDLPDCCYHEWYEDGKPASAAAKRAYKLAAIDYKDSF